jgi:outer membrane protein insertion porin family
MITGIEFSPEQPLSAQDLAKVQPLKPGEPLHQEDVARAIDGLFATGRFEDIAVEAEAAGSGVLVRFVVKLAWFVGGVDVQGRAPNPPSRAQIETAAQFTLGTPFRDQDVGAAVQSLTRLLEANGLYDAKVTPSMEREDAGQQVFVTFKIDKGKRAKYSRPMIQGDTRLTDDVILRATGWRIPVIHWWRQVTNSRTHNGVQELLKKYAKQDRLRASVQVTKLDYDSNLRLVHPDLEVEPGPRINVTAAEAKVSQRVLKRYVPVFEEGAVDDDLLTEGKRNLTDYFQSQGYYDVDVQFRVQEPEADLERIEYVISRGQRFRLVHLAVTGNSYFDLDTIRSRMFLAPSSLLLRHGRYSEAFVRKDEENISLLYRANGFRDVKVSSALQPKYKGKLSDIALTLHIEEGAQWLVQHLEIRGATPDHLKELTPRLASSDGEPFAESLLAVDRDTVLTYYYGHGFPAAAFNATWQSGSLPHQVNLVYTITEGDPQFVRDVLVSGLKVTRPSQVNQRITIKPGDPLSPIAISDIQKKFYDFGVFERVETAIQDPDGTAAYKHVLFNFEEADRYTLALGIGAQVAKFGAPSPTSLGSPSGKTGFSPEFSLNASRLNFLGLGQMISARLNYSSIEKRASLSYLQPRFRNSAGRNITYSLLYDDTFDVRTFAAKREEASVQLSQKFNKSLTGLFRFAYRRVSTSDVIIPVLLIPRLTQPVRIGMLSTTLVQDRRDNSGDPHRGMYNTADFGIAEGFFGSQRDFGRVLLRNATYYSLGRNLVLARQTQIGIIQPFSPPAGISAVESVPLPERFFSGGADSLRAFAYNEAGPRDTGASVTPGGPSSEPTGFPLGGNALFINNIELRFPLIPNIQGVLFHDVGNVYSSLQNISLRFHQQNMQDFDYAVQDVGFGLRYKTPVGPVRVDLAYVLNPPQFVGFSGTPLQLLQCGPGAAPVGACEPVPQNTGRFQFFFSIGQTF